MRKMKTAFIVILLLTGLLLPVTEVLADLTITPTRIVFLDRGRSAIIELLNITDRTNVYRMNWMEMKATESGRYEMAPIDDKNPNSVGKMVIFSPRQVTIEPHGHQVIRLSLRRPADLPTGEYRAHLSITRLAKNALRRKQDPNAKDISMALSVNLGFSIPVIVRSGKDRDLKISLSSPELKMKGTKPTLNMDINRDAGKFSSYGLVEVYWKPNKGKEQKIGTLNNIALYPELQKRRVNIPLDQNPTDGKIKVVYLGKYESEGTKWAEKTFPIGK
ncbi:MAG: hypothetical protein KAS59_03410 [Alphaproteobacteria bacterium]|nr:hypothetical protein [Alphaproteobacteria bacterium]MCK5556375.1 hypothetical protein [Alphaproteobacteria bacterium]